MLRLIAKACSIYKSTFKIGIFFKMKTLTGNIAVQYFKEMYVQNIQFHKGSFCIYKPIFCQEGYCNECIQSLAKTNDPISVIHSEHYKNTYKLQQTGAQSGLS